MQLLKTTKFGFRQCGSQIGKSDQSIYNSK